MLCNMFSNIIKIMLSCLPNNVTIKDMYYCIHRIPEWFDICKQIHFSEFDDTERSKNYAPSLPSWMCSPVVAGSDCTELEAMAIPSSDTSTHQMKKEALLSNLHHRFKKDQIYVSNIIEMGKNAVLKIMI